MVPSLSQLFYNLSLHFICDFCRRRQTWVGFIIYYTYCNTRPKRIEQKYYLENFYRRITKNKQFQISIDRIQERSVKYSHLESYQNANALFMTRRAM